MSVPVLVTVTCLACKKEVRVKIDKPNVLTPILKKWGCSECLTLFLSKFLKEPASKGSGVRIQTKRLKHKEG